MPLAASSGGSVALGAVVWIVIIAAYWVPSIVAGGRHVPNLGAVVIINAFLGWSLIGWVVALAMACRSKPQPLQYVVPPGFQPQQYGPEPVRSYGTTVDAKGLERPEGYR